MSANDEDDFIRREIDWIAVPLKEDKPFLGICLGAQMCARQLGGRVFRHPEGHAEIGYYPIRPTAAGLAVVEQWPERVYQWHREGFDLPPGAELLAEGDTFEVQAIRYGPSLRAAIPSRRDARHDAQMDHPRPRSAWNCRARGRAPRILPTARSTTTPRALGSAFSSNAGSEVTSLGSRCYCPPASCWAK